MDISQTVAAVTGGASGLGAACVEEIVARGGRAAILDRDEARGRALAERLGPAAVFAPTDVTDEASVAAALDACVSAHGALTAAVNCAGIAVALKTLGRDGPHPLDTFRTVLDVNLTGSFNVARLAAERMATSEPQGEDGERGVIVHTASVAAFEGQKGQPAYAASKGGIVGVTLPMARDLAALGIRVCTIAPGLFLTPMMESLPEEARTALAQQPLFPRRLGRPQEFGRLACFLIESAYMNGSVVRIDGGIRLP